MAKGGIPTSIETLKLPRESCGILNVLKACGFASSNADARRLIAGNGVKINNNIVTDPTLMIENLDEFVISKGKNKFMKICFE